MAANDQSGFPPLPTNASDPATTGSSDSSSWLTGLDSFLSSPSGELATFGGVGALGYYSANRAQGNTQALTTQLAGSTAPYTATGKATIGQLTGGPSVGGPMGAAITGETTAAGELAGVAEQYGTGKLTPEQELQLKQFQEQNQTQVDAAFATGNQPMVGSARTQATEQVQNATAMERQNLVAGNVNLAASALNTVQQTYTSLLSNALAQGQLGLQAAIPAVQMQLQSDAQISAALGQLMSGLATGLGTAYGAKAPSGAPTAAGGVSTLLKGIQGLGGGGGSVGAPQVPQGDSSGFQPGGGGGGTDYSPFVSSADSSPQNVPGVGSTGWDYGANVGTDVSSNPDWLSGFSTDSSGGDYVGA